jgi:hypothetical protein
MYVGDGCFFWVFSFFLPVCKKWVNPVFNAKNDVSRGVYVFFFHREGIKYIYLVYLEWFFDDNDASTDSTRSLFFHLSEIFFQILFDREIQFKWSKPDQGVV